MVKNKTINGDLPIIYQSENGSIELNIDDNNETIWANQQQISLLFGKDRSVITKHINNIFKTDEIEEKSNVQFLHIANSDKPIKFYSLDVILSVGYRINSKNATKFRQWANRILHQHIVQGWTINDNRIKKNYNNFLKTIESLKILNKDNILTNDEILELIKTFSQTWFSLDAYDKNNLGNTCNINCKETNIEVSEFKKELIKLKKELKENGEAGDLFATERDEGSLKGIFGSICQSFLGKDLYNSLEEKAANLLYLIVKNHPFFDGNKRSGAFAFIWFLKKYNLLDTTKINPQTLTTLTILIAESNPKDKDKMIRLILELLK